MYHALPDAVVFFQGGGGRGGVNLYPVARSFIELLVHRGKWTNVFRTVNDINYISMSGSMADCTGLGLQHCAPGPPNQFSCMQKLHERHSLTPSHVAALVSRDGSGGGVSVPRAYAVYANAQFGVTRDRLLGRSLSLYEALLEEFETNETEACFSHVPTAGAKGSKGAAGHHRPHRGTCGMLEYMWPTVLGEPPVLDPRKTMSGEHVAAFRHGIGSVFRGP